MIPTLEYMLTPGSLHFSATGPHGGHPDFMGKISPVGSPVNGFGTSVYGGAYLMTGDQVPLLRQIGIDGGARYQNLYGNTPAWHESLALYNYTKNPQCLADAKAGADQYIAEKLDAPQYQIPAFDSFINISYSPYWQGLLDLYETTKEQKYLDAAVEGASVPSPSLKSACSSRVCTSNSSLPWASKGESVTLLHLSLLLQNNNTVRGQ